MSKPKKTATQFEQVTKKLSRNLRSNSRDSNDRRWETMQVVKWLTGINRPDSEFDFLLLKICKKGALLEICDLLIILEERELLKIE